jgi:cobaltochelatase CobN
MMHLLSAITGTLADGAAAVDLGQTPGDIVVLSAADSDLAVLAAAQRALVAENADRPSLRLASLLRLQHNYSVDLYAERVLSRARLVVARVLGGRGYWLYGVDRLAELARDGRMALALLPGDDRPDPELARLSTATPEAQRRLWRYLAEGGIGNAAEFLRYAAHLLGRDDAWREPAPLLRAGLYWPGEPQATLDRIRDRWLTDAPVAAVVFYRALAQAANAAPIDALVAALAARGLNPLPLWAASLKDAQAAAILGATLAAAPPDIILNATAFAAAAPGEERRPGPFDAQDCPVLQVILAGGDAASWRQGTRGLSPQDVAMNVALPEVDGRIVTRALSFKEALPRDPLTEAEITAHVAVADRVAFVADLARNWVRLRRTPAPDRRIALVLANYPNRDGRIGNGVGLDTPASAVAVLRALAAAGYRVEDIPPDGDALIERLLAGPTNARPGRAAEVTFSRADYGPIFAGLPPAAQDKVSERWGPPERDPFFREGRLDCGHFAIPAIRCGNVAVMIQPARGYGIDLQGTYHDPVLAPPHGYLAAYGWIADGLRAHAVVHLGKHGTVEWLPGKAHALSAECFPEAALGALPHLYPFIVNDPGEGAQAKRRAQAVVIDHLTPPLTRADTYGNLAELERLIDEYYSAASGDPRRLAHLGMQILERVRSDGLDRDAGIAGLDDDAALRKLDGYLCELKELQIRDGLHVFGSAPTGDRLTDLLVALARIPRGRRPEDASLLRALAEDLALGFDPLSQENETGRSSAVIAGLDPAIVTGSAAAPSVVTRGSSPRVTGRTGLRGVADLEALARALVAGEERLQREWTRTAAVLRWIDETLRPAVVACGDAEIAGLLAGLGGRFVAPGPSGAPTRGRPEVLPTGRNFYSVDTRAVPTRAAWELGRRSAELLLARHVQEHGAYPRRLALSAWGTANMRTGGDDVAQALALMGAAPEWETRSGRVTGFRVMPLAELGRPRVDVTFRISGFFRDAFANLIDLIDGAARAVAALDEPAATNPLAERVRADRARLEAAGVPKAEALRRAGYRVFGARPGAYGAGLQTLIDERLWRDDGDLAEAYLSWGGYAYGAGADGVAARDLFRERLAAAEAVVHNQDNREHDILDSDAYWQFEGGLAAAVRHLAGAAPAVYHADHAQPEAPRIRTLEEEVALVIRARVLNPKWLAGIMRHGYRGGFEMAATVDYLVAFAATARVVRDHHFDAVFAAYLEEEPVLAFLRQHNPAALAEIAGRLGEAIERGLWRPARNSVRERLGVG